MNSVQSMSADILRSLSIDQLLAECADASAYATSDPEGSVALLEEARRRTDEGDLEPSKFALVRAALEICCDISGMKAMAVTMQPSHPWHMHKHALRTMVGEQPLSFLYHGTLRSRLNGIARDGLIPAKRPKRWFQKGVTEHAATGVFFERNWRRASHWVGAAAVDKDMRPTKGAVIRIPVGDLAIERDLRSLGSLIVRQVCIPVDEAAVLLFPFTVTKQWIPLQRAVEVARLAHKRSSSS
jgi:hypothetical protein